MDRRSWPWKKKSSDKVTVVLDASVSAQVPHTQEKCRKPSQLSAESFADLTSLQDEVKSYKEKVQAQDIQITELHKKLSIAQEDIVNNEALVKQHAKVAEEAISGWEKAETDASTLKIHLESVTAEKRTTEDRAAHMDNALKECMRVIRNLKEEHEQELHDVIFSKNKQFEKLKLDLESKIANLDQQLHNSEAENAALGRSLQERCSLLNKISDEKAQAVAEMEHLRGGIESYEREIGSLKYELHLAAKELEIRNEENNMSARSAEVSNKHHSDAVRKITKLESECQRLRGLVRKKLPSPAALAQMKLEIGTFGRDSGDIRRRTSVRTSSPPFPFSDFQLEELRKLQKDNEFLTEQLLAMEDDTKRMKEALANRNVELIQSREVRTHQAADIKSILKMSNDVSLTSMSEDGNEYAASSAGSWSAGLNSDFTQFKQSKAESVNQLDFMDDFLEMEKLACLSDDSNTVSYSKREDADVPVTPSQDTQLTLDEVAAAITKIHEFVVSFSKAAEAVQDLSPEEEEDGLVDKVKEFSEKFSRNMYVKIHVVDFVVELSHILQKAVGILRFTVLGLKGNDAGHDGSDCIDKVALPEHEMVTKHVTASSVCDPEELEKMKTEKEDLETDLIKCLEDLDIAQTRLSEAEGKLSELKSLLVSSQKSNGIAETQLKCMVESYRSLERRTEELKTELNLQHEKTKKLEDELHEEKTKHQDALDRFKDLQDQLQRNSSHSETSKLDVDHNTRHEKELAAAAEKLAECQETIYLLGRQLKSFRSQPEPGITPEKEQDVCQRGSNLANGEQNITFENLLEVDRAKTEAAASVDIVYKTGSESPMSDVYNYLRSPMNVKNQKHRSTQSQLPPAYVVTQTPEKHSRGISRFFTTKGKF